MAEINSIGFGPQGLTIGGRFGGHSPGGPTMRGRQRKAMEDQSAHYLKTVGPHAKAHYTSIVKGAQAAGLHPLFALGGSVPPSGGGGMITQGYSEDTGQRFQVSKHRISPTEAAAIRESNARTDLLKTEKDLAIQQYNDSKRARFNQDAEKPLMTNSHSGAKVERHQIDFANTPDAEDWERRYGEVGEFIGSIINMGADAMANTPPELWDKLIDLTIQGREYERKRPEFKKRNLRQDYRDISP